MQRTTSIGLDAQTILFAAVSIIIPFAFQIGNELFFLAVIALQFLLAIGIWKDPQQKMLFVFLLSILYSGVWVMGAHVYDIVTIALIVLWLVRRNRIARSARGHIVVAIVLLLGTMLIAAVHPSSAALLEIVRILICLAIFFLFMARSDRGWTSSPVLIAISIMAVYYAFMLYALHGGAPDNYESRLLTTSLFPSVDEFRLCGFFSDPNKFMSFLLVILFLTTCVTFKGKVATVIVLLAGLASTGSRTILICLPLLAVVLLAHWAARQNKAILICAVLVIAVVLAAAICIIGIDSIFQRMYLASSQLFGRDDALSVSPTYAQDNRILIYLSSLQLIAQQPIWGYGWDAMNMLPYPTHNTFLYVLMCGGAIMLAFYCAFLVPIARKLFRLQALGAFVACIGVPMMLLDLFDYRLLFCLFGLTCSCALHPSLGKEKGGNPACTSLIVLTKNFGLDFTGATAATQNLVARWAPSFGKIVVLTMHEGDVKPEILSCENVEIRVCKSKRRLTKSLQACAEADPGSILYSDDHLLGMVDTHGLKTVHTYHGNWPDMRKHGLLPLLKSFYFIPLYTWAFQASDCVVSISEYMTSFAAQSNDNVTVIRNGINHIARKGCTDKAPSDLVMVGTIDGRKYRQALPVIQLLAEKAPGVKVHIYGNKADDGLVQKLDALPNVIIEGYSDSVDLSAYRAFLCCSQFENLSIAVCEAIANHTPVVAYDVGGLGEVVSDDNGILIQPYDARAFSDAVAAILHGSTSLSGDSSTLDEFDWDISAKRYLHVFETLGSSRA